MLAALVSGAAARRFEELPLEAAIAEVMAVLRGWYSPRGISVPEPLQVRSLRGQTRQQRTIKPFGSGSGFGVWGIGLQEARPRSYSLARLVGLSASSCSIGAHVLYQACSAWALRMANRGITCVSANKADQVSC